MIAQAQYMDLINKFLSELVPAQEFCTVLTQWWIQDRDEMYAVEQAWSEPYAEQLRFALQSKTITEEEYNARSTELWAFAGDPQFRTLVDTVHSACSVFRAIPEMDWEIDEEQLRKDVVAAIYAFKNQHRLRSDEYKLGQ